MEPSPFSDGNDIRCVSDYKQGRLQWSHRLSAMETDRSGRMGATAKRFNGAIAFQRWKRGDSLLGSAAQVPASMEPSPFSDGNTSDAARRISPSRFNGAIAFQRWKHAEIVKLTMASGRFNGAIAFQRWKHLGRQPVEYHHHASMEPSPFSDGNHRLGLSLCLLVMASMEPSPFSDGNVPPKSVCPPSLISLQWSHRLSAMETSIASSMSDLKMSEIASMEPSPFSDGNAKALYAA